MRIVFMGTPEFAVEFLKHLIKSEHEVIAVATQPDRQSGRGMELHSPPVKTAALEAGIPILQPNSVKNPEFAEELKKLNADIFVVVAFSILPKEVLSASKYGAINIHGSLLPKYRGAAPVQWAIANCEETTGLTVFLLDEKMDHGPILEQRELSIEQDDTTESLLKKMVTPGCEALDAALSKLQAQNFTPIPQNHSQASSAPKLKKEDGLIDWNMSALQIHKRLCAFTPWPGAYTNLNGQKIFIRKTNFLKNIELKSGEISIQKNNVFVGTGDGALSVLEIQAEGKKRMPAADYFRGVAGDSHCFG
ncbi:MAG: methionyl-tRNA formyltransferase [Fibromonadaceae bacterium]|jgi:methionyl-tRNA formyltransferase|nr:methionyl-tRNA formyltransferase [Fibromonadaceae bacterium]